MITFLDSKEKTKDTDKCLDSQLWHACAGSMVQMPPVNSKVFYFPQGHAEHSTGNVEFRNFPRIPSYVPSRILAIKFMADSETDEVYARIKLVPLSNNDVDREDEDCVRINGSDSQDKPISFAKTLTQSDANNGGGFSVPRYCAETIFPRLDYSADPPVQTILAKDVHGETWKFRHIYRGTPRRHLLTTGWSTFVNQKKLVAGDSIVFLRAENGDLCVGIRRAKRAAGGSPESLSGWNPAGGSGVMPYGGFSPYLREDENKLLRNCNGGGANSARKGKVSGESVVEAATLAANGKPFEVVYYPRSSTPEFCVKASLVKAAMQVRWCSGMRFKMPFETEDSSRISWFMGTIASVQVADPVRWPDSPWRLLQVTWDEPDLLQNVKHVSPWLVELVSNMPSIHISPFSPPQKKMRLTQPPDFFMDSQFHVPVFSGNLLGPNSPFSSCPPDNAPAGMQGARHEHSGLSLSDIHFNKLQSTLFAAHFPQFDNGLLPIRRSGPPKHRTSEDISCLLTIGNSNQMTKEPEVAKPTQLVLFGQPILTEEQMSLTSSADTVSPIRAGNSSSEGNGDKADGSEGHYRFKNNPQPAEATLEVGQCKVFMESEDVGRTLDLSTFGSYEELYRKLGNMFGVECSDMVNHVLYRDDTGSVKPIGDESFSEFMKTAKRLTILADSSRNKVGI